MSETVGIVARLSYSGLTPASDANTYNLFNSRTMGPAGTMGAAGIKRVLLSLKYAFPGTLKWYSSTDGGTTWNQLDQLLVGTPATTSSFRREWLVEAYRDFKLDWVNGGDAQTTWIPEVALSVERASSGVREGAGTEAQPVTSVTPAGTADPGQLVALTVANVVYQTAAGKACPAGSYVSAPLANTAAIYVGYTNTVTTSLGVELQPGDREFFPVANTNQIFMVSGTASQNAHILAS